MVSDVGVGADLPTVLIVDDDSDIRDVVSMILTRAGYRVLTAANGYEALDRVRDAQPLALILLDLMMPGLNGWQVLDALAAEQRTSTIPVMVLTGGSVPEGLPPSVRSCLRKPVELSTLVQEVRRHVPPAT